MHFQYLKNPILGKISLTMIDLNQSRFNSSIHLCRKKIHDKDCYEFQSFSLFFITIYKRYQKILNSPEIPKFSFSYGEFPIPNWCRNSPDFQKMGKNSPSWQRWGIGKKGREMALVWHEKAAVALLCRRVRYYTLHSFVAQTKNMTTVIRKLRNNVVFAVLLYYLLNSQ